MGVVVKFEVGNVVEVESIEIFEGGDVDFDVVDFVDGVEGYRFDVGDGVLFDFFGSSEFRYVYGGEFGDIF